MSSVACRSKVVAGGLAFAAGVNGVFSPMLQAQTQLPGIVINTPSPVSRAPGSRVPAASATTANAAASASPGSAPPPADLILEPFASAPGLLIASGDAFVPVTIATAREIVSEQGQTITDTLQTKPGITGSTFAAGANRPIIRGLDTYRVRVQENGIGSHDVAALSEDHAVPIDPFAADRIEVVRGPATLRYGSQAIGGVVAVENNRIPTFVPARGFMAEIRGGLTSVDNGRDGAFKATAGAGNFAVHADGFERRADDYRTPRGTQTNTSVDSDGFAVGSSYIWSSGFVGVSFSRISSLYGIPFNLAEPPDETVKIDLTQDRLQSKGEWRVRSNGIEALRYWFGASDYAHNEVIVEENIIGTRFTNKEQEGRVELQHLPVLTGLGELRGAIGAQWGHRNVKAVAVAEPVDPLLDPARTNTLAGFLFEELQVTSRLRLQAAGRLEHTTVDGNGILFDAADPAASSGLATERTFRPVSASLGGLYELPLGVVARLTGQYVERAPDAGELFSKGVHEATGTFEIGNPLLDKEKAATIELGFKRAIGRFRFDSSVYYTKFDGFIFKQITGRADDGTGCEDTLATCGAGSELNLVAFQQRDATFYGSEIAAHYDVAPIWRGVWGIDAQYDFVRATFDGDNVPRIPPHRLGGGVYYRDGNWFARAGVLHAFDQDEINEASGERATPGYTLVSAELSYTTRLAAPSGSFSEATFGIKGENLANDEVLNHASFKRQEDVLLPGASVRAFGSIKFN